MPHTHRHAAFPSIRKFCWAVIGLASVNCFAAEPAVTTPDQLDVPPGFKVDLVLTADKNKNGSWISMARDHKGRLLLAGQRGQPITRVTIQDGKIEKQEALKLNVSEAMGMLDTGDTLYINGSDGKKFGLFRCRDTNGDDQYDQVEMLREWKGGAGEHGAHGLVMKEGKLYTVCGNFVDVPEDVSPLSPHRNYADDRVLPRAEDGNGFGAGRKPPGGFVLRMDLDGKNPELFASGERNTYDIAFNADGELFGFDSDMEWDWGTPWYRPTRIFQAVSGADHGFREGSAKWPTYYFDSLPPVVNIGVGSPTGVTFGYGAKFPAKYQKALYALDWSYGRLFAVHMTPQGAAYTATFENFVAPKTLKAESDKHPLNLTDAVVGPDGALYFTIGGRGTAAALYRVSYAGKEATAAADTHDAAGAEARELRHKLEAFHEKPDPKAVEFAWPHLASEDRAIQYAARIAIERNPVSEWRDKALAETNPRAAMAALLALARYGDKEGQAATFNVLKRWPTAQLPEDLQLEKLRVVEVSISRHGLPPQETQKMIASKLDPLYPAKSEWVNRELCQILLAVNAPEAVAKTVKLLEAAKTQEEQVFYVHHLRTIKDGWTPELRKEYLTWWGKDMKGEGHPQETLQWFADAGRPYDNGASFPNFIKNFHNDVTKTLSDAEKQNLADAIAAYTPPGDARRRPPVQPRTKVVKEWTTADLAPSLDQVGKGRNFRRGREVYEAAQCAACHRFGNEGGAIGPDLTAISSRFKRQDILESMTEPSKVVSEQYANTAVVAKKGGTVVGRIVEENDDHIVLMPDPLKPDNKVKLSKANGNITRRQLSKTSPMPEGLINVLTKDEILDLVAYMESGGRRDHPDFAKTN